MTKDEYLKAIDILDLRIKKTIAQKKIVRDAYVKKNAPYPIGTKIRLFLPKHFKGHGHVVQPPCVVEAFIGGYSADANGTIEPKLYQVKKDGTQSTARFYLRDYPIVNKDERKIKWELVSTS